ncbi:MAG: hypothetical protein JXA73_11700 [Acidobacteria bacterium]|nr:hypothetical protein [Acidobacteriota bacterium]
MARVKEYAHLVKPMIVKNAPAGLYAEPRIWMEARDLGGFNAHFSYGFIKEPCVCHPLEGSLVHPYNELLVFVGFQSGDILKLGAEISVELGEEREEHVFDKPSVILIPRGLPHGPVRVNRLDNPVVHYSIGLGPEYKAQSLPKKSKTTGSKHARLIKRMVTSIDPKAADTGFAKVTDSNGVMHPAEFGVGPGNGDQIVWLYGRDLEGMDVNFTWGLYSKCGKWHRGGEAHTHPEEEILCFLGLDPDNINYLGAELELGMGKDYERHIFNTPTVAICPKGFPHLPLITRWVDKPYGFIVICLSGEHESPWVEA